MADTRLRKWPLSKAGFIALQRQYGCDVSIAMAMGRSVNATGDQRRKWGLDPAADQDTLDSTYRDNTVVFCPTEDEITEMYDDRMYEDADIVHKPLSSAKPIARQIIEDKPIRQIAAPTPENNYNE